MLLVFILLGLLLIMLVYLFSSYACLDCNVSITLAAIEMLKVYRVKMPTKLFPQGCSAD